MTPLPKLASTLPVWRSNLKMGSTGVLSQSTGPPPAVPAPQRSYPQILPSFGSISIPADVPHLRPAGSSPQLRVTFGAGLGRPSPVMKLAAFAEAAGGAVAAVAPVPAFPQAARKSAAQVLNAGSRNRGVDMTPPQSGGLIIARLNRLRTSGSRLQEGHSVALNTDTEGHGS